MAAQVVRSCRYAAGRGLTNLRIMKNARCSSSFYYVLKSVGLNKKLKPALYPLKRYFHGSPELRGSVVQFNLSDIGEGIKEVTVKEWFVNEGDVVAQFDNICEVQSDKASVTITSRYDGQIKKLYYGIDDTALVGKPLVDIELQDGDSSSSSSSSSSSDSEGEIIESGSSVEEKMPGMFNVKTLATPAVRRIAMENKIQLKDIHGTGKAGRVLKEDIVAYVETLKSPKSSGVSVQSASSPLISNASPPAAEDRIEPIKGVMRAMVRTMTKAKEIPHFVYSDEVSMNKLVELRTQLKEITFKRGGVKLSYMPFFVKAVSMALRDFPTLNSSVDDDCTHVIYKAAHNIGVAMDTPLGLVVPTVKNVQELTVFDIAAEINRLQRLGLKGNLKQEDVTGGTFTISNIGVVGGTYTKPVILPPEVAIVALGKMQMVPRFDPQGNVMAAHILYVSWAADHRIVDGAMMARFSNMWKDYVESPSTMLLDMK